jgi:hypothetical protein
MIEFNELSNCIFCSTHAYKIIIVTGYADVAFTLHVYKKVIQRESGKIDL